MIVSMLSGIIVPVILLYSYFNFCYFNVWLSLMECQPYHSAIACIVDLVFLIYKCIDKATRKLSFAVTYCSLIPYFCLRHRPHRQ